MVIMWILKAAYEQHNTIVFTWIVIITPWQVIYKLQCVKFWGPMSQKLEDKITAHGNF